MLDPALGAVLRREERNCSTRTSARSRVRTRSGLNVVAPNPAFWRMATARPSVRGAFAPVPRSVVMSRLETSVAPAIRATVERSRESSPAVTPGPGLPVPANAGAIAAQAIAAMKIEICTFFIVVGLRLYAGLNAGYPVRPRIIYGDQSGLSTHFAGDRTWRGDHACLARAMRTITRSQCLTEIS